MMETIIIKCIPMWLWLWVGNVKNMLRYAGIRKCGLSFKRFVSAGKRRPLFKDRLYYLSASLAFHSDNYIVH